MTRSGSRTSSSSSSSQTTSPSWDLFTNLPRTERETKGLQRQRQDPWPESPPWRRFLQPEAEQEKALQKVEEGYWQQYQEWLAANPGLNTQERDRLRGEVFRLPRTSDGALRPEGEAVRLAVNAAIHLRRPLLVSGTPGCGKTSLAYAIAEELDLGPVLSWDVTPRSQLQDGQFLYDAVGRLQEAGWSHSSSPSNRKNRASATAKEQDPASAAGAPAEERPTSDYLKLGPVGTAFLPFSRPRVLLIDELDKGDLQLPNELLNLFEEGFFEIPQLVREARRHAAEQPVHTADPGCTWPVSGGRVVSREFPIIVLTSNGEREFPAAFHRRCIRIAMPTPTHEDLVHVVGAHFKASHQLSDHELGEEIRQFLGDEGNLDRATDQLLNALYLLTLQQGSPASEEQRSGLRQILYRQLHT
ncbi:AAA family ATPase [Microcystis elabens FACHB-917]|nr:AAA family ATPase [Microcystis elabens FACHB-917]